MTVLRNLFYKHYKYYYKAITFVAIILGIILAFYPTLFSLQYCKLDKEKFELIKGQLSTEATSFIDSKMQHKIKSPKLFIKSIPTQFSESDKFLILDILQYSYDGKNFHLLILSLCFIGAITFIVFRELQSAKKYSIAHSLVHLHKAIHCLRDDWTKIFQINKDKTIAYNKEVATECISKSLDEVERYYSIVIGAPCRACIKAWNNPKDSIKTKENGGNNTNKLKRAMPATQFPR